MTKSDLDDFSTHFHWQIFTGEWRVCNKSPDELSLANPSCVPGAVSTSENWDANRHTVINYSTCP